MKSIRKEVLYSYKELKNVRNLVLVGLLIATHLILTLFNIQVTPIIRLSFSFLASAVIGLFFGPTVGAICGGLTDILGFIIHPTGPYFPGFTLSSILVGTIYGFAFYKKEISVLRCAIVELIICLFLNILLGTVWLSILYGKGFLVLLPVRALKSFIMLPINTTMLYIFLNIILKIKKTAN